MAGMRYNIKEITFSGVLTVLIAASLYPLTTSSPEPAVLPGLFLCFVLVLFLHPSWGFYLIVFLIPFGAYRQVGAIQGLRIHWLLAAMLSTYIFLKHLPEKDLPPSAIRTGWWRPVFALLAINVMASLFSPYPATAFKELTLLAAGFVFVAMTMYFMDRHVLTTALPNVIIWSNAIGAALASLGYFFNVSLFAEKVFEGGFKRGLGTSTDPNNLALMLLFTLPFLATLLFTGHRFLTRVWAAVGILICLMGLVTTFSRSGGVVLVLTGMLILHQHRGVFRPRTLGLMTLNVLLILTLSITLVPGQYWQRQMSLLAGNDFSLGRRTSYLYVARDAFLQKPLLGWGTGVFMHVYENSEQAKAFTRKGYTNRRKAHNTYLEFLIGSGIIGFALFMALIIVAWKNFRRAITNFRQAGDPVSAIQTATFRTAFISLLLFLVLFSDMYHKYLLLSLGVSCGALRLSGEALKGSS